MTSKKQTVIYVEPDGCCAAFSSDELAVLACSLPAGHDEGFRKSRELATSLCESVAEEARRSTLNQEALSRLIDALFSCAEWESWHISFYIVSRRGGRVRAFNCGVAGLAWVTASDTIRELLAPNTVGRKLRREGLTTVPSHVEHVGATVAGKGLLPPDIGATEIDMDRCKTVIAVAEPRIIDSLSELSAAAADLGQLRNSLETSLASMNNPTQAFVLWSPHS